SIDHFLNLFDTGIKGGALGFQDWTTGLRVDAPHLHTGGWKSEDMQEKFAKRLKEGRNEFGAPVDARTARAMQPAGEDKTSGKPATDLLKSAVQGQKGANKAEAAQEMDVAKKRVKDADFDGKQRDGRSGDKALAYRGFPGNSQAEEKPLGNSPHFLGDSLEDR